MVDGGQAVLSGAAGPQPGPHPDQNRNGEAQRLAAVHLAELRAEEEVSRRLNEAYQHIQRDVAIAHHEEHVNHLRSHAGLINLLEQESEQTRLQMLRAHHAEHGLLAEASQLAGHATALELHAFWQGQQTTLDEAAAQHRVVVERLENTALAEHELRMQLIRQQAHEQIAHASRAC